MPDHPPRTFEGSPAARWAVRPALVCLAYLLLFGGFLSVYRPKSSESGTVAVPVLGKLPLLDWITLCALVVVLLVAVPSIVKWPQRVRSRLAALGRDPVAVVGAAVLLATLLTATVGQHLIDPPAFDPSIVYNPPIGASIETWRTTGCTGTVSGEYCHGSTRHLLGTNHAGNSMLSVVVYGLWTSIRVGVSTAVVAGGIGTVVGVVAGTVGGKADTILMRYVDVQSAVPAFFAYAILTLALRSPGDLELMIVVFGLTSWGGVARVTRSEVLRIREKQFLRAARSAGAGPLYLIRAHVFPNVGATVSVQLTTLLSLYMLYEAALSFLELGETDPETYSLGTAIATGFESPQVFHWWDVWWVVAVPAVALTVLIVSVLVVGDRVTGRDSRSQ
jgi:peptide/nickel transport system permease protein